MEQTAVTLISAITDGASAVVGSMVSTISDFVAEPTVLTLMGLAIGYGVVKFVFNRLPMVRNR